MRIGFITQLLWPRYGEFWTRLLADAGAEIALPQPEAVAARLTERALREIPAASFKLAAAQALSLSDTDYLVVPQLNRERDIQRGSAQDPWIADFPAALQATVALPPLIAVPVSVTGLDALAIEVLSRIVEPVKARRIWERHRMQRQPHYPEPHMAGQVTAVVGQPWLFIPGVLKQLAGGPYLWQHQLDPQLLRQEAWRVEPRLIDTDAEVLGAARYLARRGEVGDLLMLVDRAAAADLWLWRRVQKGSHKPVAVRYLDELFADEAALAALFG